METILVKANKQLKTVFLFFFLFFICYHLYNNKEYLINERNFITDKNTNIYCYLKDTNGEDYFFQKCDYDFFIYSLLSISFDKKDYIVDDITDSRFLDITFNNSRLEYNSNTQDYIYKSQSGKAVNVCDDYKGLYKIPDFLSVYKNKFKNITNKETMHGLCLKRLLYNFDCLENFVYYYNIEIKASNGVINEIKLIKTLRSYYIH